MREIYRFSEDEEEQELFLNIINRGYRTTHSPILWNGCGTFESQIVYMSNVYEHSISFGSDRILRVEREDLDIVYQDPKPYISDKTRRLVLGLM